MSIANHDNTEPMLPPELERAIFECAANLFPGLIPMMLTVANRVLEWLRPFLYTHISITPQSPSLSALLHLLTTLPPAHAFFYDSNIAKSVFVGHTRWLNNETMLVLRLFGKNTEDLTILSANRALVPLLRKIPLRRLAVSLVHLFDGPGYNSENLNGGSSILANLASLQGAFVNVTHLELFDFLHTEPLSAMGYLCAPSPSCPFNPQPSPLPSLTHLCLHSFVHRNQLLFVLEHNPRLQLLVNVHRDTEPEWGLGDIAGRLAITEDVRFVLMTMEVSLPAHARRWESARRGLVAKEEPRDFWVMAKAFVEKRKAGTVLPAWRCWIMAEDFQAE
ncbi:hypothetical protein MIND_01266500 [Mycena indigotica]|uniref:Uncharacterized protein n=1 Tax=Mycena indigotica TaxID=2126181 RepID=A0A8H6S1K2_9AGAR|nr:uncharacterized protein MIND_01266500 [Mycena indigotica]KAF7291229.1 hypothetical protein MIND_01266500 [Mycena indigotica]